jgi:large subunit ribosomal protein L3
MTQFIKDGMMIPVTVIHVETPNVVIQKKTAETDGYAAVQVGYGEIREKLVNRPKGGQFSKAGVKAMRHLREMRLDDIEALEVGAELGVEQFEAGEKVKVSGISKGKGFAGAIKRHGSHRGPMSHGSHYHRRAGSLGACSDPSRVFKGKKQPGHMGAERVSVKNLELVNVDAERRLLLIRGAVPGADGGLVEVTV